MEIKQEQQHKDYYKINRNKTKEEYSNRKYQIFYHKNINEEEAQRLFEEGFEDITEIITPNNIKYIK